MLTITARPTQDVFDNAMNDNEVLTEPRREYSYHHAANIYVDGKRIKVVRRLSDDSAMLNAYKQLQASGLMPRW